MKVIDKINELPWHVTRRWRKRKVENISMLIIHQELGDSDIEAVNEYHTNPNHISPRGCPHFCYHYGIESNGEIIQANEINDATWHVKGKNTVSIGIMLVGNFNGVGHTLGREGPNKKQLDSLKWLVEKLQKEFKLSNTDVFGHYHFGKPACPGFALSEWIEQHRSGYKQKKTIPKTVKNLQKCLNDLGYECGKVDGIIGVKTLAAIRKFQAANRLHIDGIAGPKTWAKIMTILQ